MVISSESDTGRFHMYIVSIPSKRLKEFINLLAVPGPMGWGSPHSLITGAQVGRSASSEELADLLDASRLLENMQDGHEEETLERIRAFARKWNPE